MATVSTTLDAPTLSGVFVVPGISATLDAVELSGEFYISVRSVTMPVMATSATDIRTVVCSTNGIQCEVVASVELGVLT